MDPAADSSAIFKEHPLFALENIYRVYRQCRRRKRRTVNAMRFEENLEENLVALHEELTGGVYRPGRSVAFLVEKPKRREIFAAAFRDRVVHHVLVGHLEPKWERRFIHDSYACRLGKGTHQGVERLRTFTRQVTANKTRRAWYLQLDIRGFFIAIDRQLLYARLAAKERDPAVLWLLKTLVFYDPVQHCVMRRARPADFAALPAHKTLFKAAPDCGLPIGNLTSQFFANVYLDALDQFVKHHLKVRHYLRYCDDFVLLSTDRAELEAHEAAISRFLAHELHLRLNARRRLRPVSDGIDFLGYIVRPDYLLVRRRVVGALQERLTRAEQNLVQQGLAMENPDRLDFPWPRQTVETVYGWLNSYLGHFRRASAYRLLEGFWRRFTWLAEYFSREGARVTYTCGPLRPARSLGAQRARFCARLPGHILVVQMGHWYEFWGVEHGLPDVGSRFHRHRLPQVRVLLWERDAPVAWIEETGRRVTGINERVLARRWPSVNESRSLSQIDLSVGGSC